MCTKRLEDAVADAELAFWAVIAKAYPEAVSGDLDPFTSHLLVASMREAVSIWVTTNVQEAI